MPTDSRAGGVTSGGPDNAALLIVIDGAVGTAELRGQAGFHLDKNQNAGISGDDVHFSITAVGPVISSDNGETGVA